MKTLAWAAMVTLAASLATAQAQPVKVGVVLAVLSGPQASLGQQVRDGFALGVESLGGKLGGFPAEVTVLDDEMKPDGAVTKVRGYLERDHAGLHRWPGVQQRAAGDLQAGHRE